MRTRHSSRTRLPKTLARFNRTFANPVMRRIAGRLPPLAIVQQRGRMTGREHTTPVIAFGTTDGLVVGVLYGTDSDWVRNVAAAGRAKVQRLGTPREYRYTRLLGREEGLRLLPAHFRGPYRLLGPTTSSGSGRRVPTATSGSAHGGPRIRPGIRPRPLPHAAVQP